MDDPPAMDVPPCDGLPAGFASTTGAWPGGLSVPASFSSARRSYALFAGEDATRAQHLQLQPLPTSLPAVTIARAQSTGIPGRAGLTFGAFGPLRRRMSATK